MGILVFFANLLFFHNACPALASVAPAAKAPAARSPFQTKFIGEGGGYAQLPPDAHDAIETGARQDGSPYSGSVPQVVDQPGLRPLPVSGPAVRPAGPPALHPALTRPRPARIPSAAPAAEPPAQRPEGRSSYSLWEGLAEPMALPPQKVGEVSEDQAAALGRQDYDSHILGQRDALGSPGPASGGGEVLAGAPGLRLEAPAAEGAGPEVFVTLNLDLRKQPDATLKDAVADLGRVAGFRQDLRFAPAAAGASGGQVSVWGWMDPQRVGTAMGVPSVSRLEINPAPRRLAAETSTDLLIGVRVSRDRAPGEAAAGLERDLAAPGLRVRRTIGTQTLPGTAETVLVVEASVPISALRRLLAHPDVVKMAPVPPRLAAAPSAPRRSAADLRRFLAFAAEQSPLLLVFTLLMLLPWVGSGMAAAARVFVPYK